uniref:Uncharacterized protein n=1 Tax=Arundo donax TaxID=35708 RepID=A0A0A9D8P3_ARUDO
MRHAKKRIAPSMACGTGVAELAKTISILHPVSTTWPQRLAS